MISRATASINWLKRNKQQGLEFSNDSIKLQIAGLQGWIIVILNDARLLTALKKGKKWKSICAEFFSVDRKKTCLVGEKTLQNFAQKLQILYFSLVSLKISINNL